MNGAMLLPEFDHEMGGLRKALERIPADKLAFKPHEKSWSLRELAGHLAQLPGWTQVTVTTTELDLAQPWEQPPLTPGTRSWPSSTTRWPRPGRRWRGRPPRT